mgnify:CR=1 FL=1
MKNNLKIILLSIGIAILVALMGTATYAYFTLEIEGEGKNNILSTFNKNMEITYTETSNVTLENAYTGDSLTKTFTVANTGNTDVYYNVTLEDVVNNFAKPEELTYRIEETSGAAFRNDAAVPTSDTTILSDIKIGTGKTHSYTLFIKFREFKTDQSYNMNKTFSGKINVVPSENSSILMGLKQDSLVYKIMNSNSSVYMDDADIIRDTDIADETLELTFFNNDKEHIIKLDSEQLGDTISELLYTNKSDNGTRIYYFYNGNTTSNNNVTFGGYCWKIIRTTETAGVKMIYNGVPTNGACTNATGDAATIGTSTFNTNTNSNAYVGYMYGTPNSSTYSEEHKNTNNSAIKTMLENWYANNLLQYNDYIEDTNYCNDRSMSEKTVDNVVYLKNGYGNSITGYDFFDKISSFTCLNSKDKFNVKNKLSTYPIGLLTAEEARVIGMPTTKKTSISSKFTYLSNSAQYWTMSPAYFDGTNANNYIVNDYYLSPVTVDTVAGVRPVIALKSTATVISGNGSLSSPYKITE